MPPPRRTESRRSIAACTTTLTVGTGLESSTSSRISSAPTSTWRSSNRSAAACATSIRIPNGGSSWKVPNGEVNGYCGGEEIDRQEVTGRRSSSPVDRLRIASQRRVHAHTLFNRLFRRLEIDGRRVGGRVARLAARVSAHLLTATTVAGDAALAACIASFLARPLVGRAFLMCGFAPLACYLALLGAIHRSKSTIFLGHWVLLTVPGSTGQLAFACSEDIGATEVPRNCVSRVEVPDSLRDSRGAAGVGTGGRN